jgi:hypothetical protein
VVVGVVGAAVAVAAVAVGAVAVAVAVAAVVGVVVVVVVVVEGVGVDVDVDVGDGVGLTAPPHLPQVASSVRRVRPFPAAHDVGNCLVDTEPQPRRSHL